MSLVAHSDSKRRVLLFLATTALAVGALTSLPAAGSAATDPAPAWRVTSIAAPSNFAPGLTDGTNFYFIHATNVGGAATDGSPVTITDQLPAGFAAQPNPTSAQGPLTGFIVFADDPSVEAPCQAGPPVTCTLDHVVQPGERIHAWVPLQTPASGPSAVTHQVTVSGGGAAPATVTEETPLTADEQPFGLQYLQASLTDAAGDPVTQAGSHPASFRLGFALRTRLTGPSHNIPGQVIPVESLKSASASLPPGFVVNPTAVPRCTEAQLELIGCPDASAVGVAEFSITQAGSPSAGQGSTNPIYSMVPPPGSPASLAFNAVSFGIFVHLLGGVDPADGYTLRAGADDLTEYGGIDEVVVDLWGDPSDPSHDALRGGCVGGGAYNDNPCPVPPLDLPFVTLPSACSGPLEFALDATSRQTGTTDSGTALAGDAAGNPTPITGCDQLDFDPTLEAQPDTTEADSPAGLDVELEVPQTNDFDELATANLKTAKVVLPEGMAVNPSASDGLEGCAPSEIGLDQDTPVTCPNGSKVGTVEIITPLLDDPVAGAVYLAEQGNKGPGQGTNPFDTLLALYIGVDDPVTGVRIKLAGKVDPDPDTGQLTATFNENPQLPFSSFKLHFKGGDRATLVSPPECGSYEVESEMSPWSAANPDNPTPAEIVTDTSSFDVTTGPNGGPCPDYLDPARFTPSLSAGTVSSQAGASSPFNLRIARPDGQQSIKQIHVDLPPGLVAKLAGVPRCAQSQIVPGVDGSTNCPAGSQIGVANIGAGAGNTPYFLSDQPVYLTEGYGGAPYGIAIDSNAVAGPFDLGHVVVRSTLNVDKDDAQVHIDSEQLPRIIEGIPLHIRDIRVNVNKPGFIQAPTNCSPMAVTGTVTGGGEDYNDTAPDASDDATVPISSPFQVSGCGSLPFSPKLSGFILNGQEGIHRSDHPNLRFTLAGTPGQANIASVAVTLPSSFQIDQANLGNICSETQLIQTQCAGRNTVGLASATTPLLDSALVGPVYAVSGSGGLPKLAVILNGPPTDPLNLLIRGVTDTVGAQIRNTFPLVPDAPVSDFDLTLNGGPAGYLVNNQNLCDGTGSLSKAQRKKLKRIDDKNARKRARARMLRSTGIAATALFTAQNGDTLTQQVPISADCPAAKTNKKSKKSKRSGKGKH